MNTVDALIKAGANSNCVETATGDTPLHIAAYRNDPDIVSSLLCLGNADPTITDFDGCTALHLAAGKGFSRVVDRQVGAADKK